MATASAYILKVRPDRRETLLRSRQSGYGGQQAAEPVPTFNHSRRAPLIVLASFDDGLLTHVGNARKGMAAGTQLVRLNLMNLDALSKPISFDRIIDSIPTKFRPHLKKVIETGGLIPPKTLRAVVESLSSMDSALAEALERMSASREGLIAEFSQKQKENLAIQKETLTAALEISGVGTHEILEWRPEATSERTSFLDGLPEARVREDVMINADLSNLPGFAAVKEAPFISACTFQSADNPSVRVTVLMANRLPLEQQTGADLIYFNELYRSFVMVQYKALEKRDENLEFRWQAGDQFSDEMKRKDHLLDELNKIQPCADPDGFRFSTNPFFLKFCSRVVFNPDDRGMFPGMYLPHGLWKTLAASTRLKGPLGGNVLSYENVGRRLSGPEFTTLVSGSWVGTTITQSVALEKMIHEVLKSGRTVTFAVKRAPPPDPDAMTQVLPELDDGEAISPAQALVEIMRG